MTALILVVCLSHVAAAYLARRYGRQEGREESDAVHAREVAQLRVRIAEQRNTVAFLEARLAVLQSLPALDVSEVTAIACRGCGNALKECSCPKVLAGHEGSA